MKISDVVLMLIIVPIVGTILGYAYNLLTRNSSKSEYFEAYAFFRGEKYYSYYVVADAINAYYRDVAGIPSDLKAGDQYMNAAEMVYSIGAAIYPRIEAEAMLEYMEMYELDRYDVQCNGALMASCLKFLLIDYLFLKTGERA